MAITACLFDMGNVLVHFSHQKMFRNVAELTGISVERAEHLLMHSGLNDQLETGRVTEEQFHAQIQQQTGSSVDLEALKTAAADIFELNDSILPLIDELKRLGLRLILLSNTSITHQRFIEQRFDVLSRFDALTTSWEVGTLKPGMEIYADAVSKAGCPANDCFYTDDIEDYVVQARALGINAEVYTSTPDTRKALRTLGVNVAAK